MPSLNTPKILIVEDEPAIAEMIAVNLRFSGMEPYLASDTQSARRLIERAPPDLILLDWMLPGQSGIEFARQLRSNESSKRLPIIVLTARSEETDRLHGFDSGADDYVTKPFSPRELIARIKAVLRRAGSEQDGEAVEIAGLKLDPQTFRVSGDDVPIKLSATEFKLLGFLMRNPERVWPRDRLLNAVWGNDSFIEERTVDVHIRRLRRALTPTGHERLVETVRGGGYRFVSV
jgi:two-component system, OmpR family, phosphate regulon response regulator PhoB